MLLKPYERKRKLREQMLALRNSKPVSELDYLSSEICARLLRLQEVVESRTISTYMNTGSEVRTRELVEWALSSSKMVIVPITDKLNKRLIFSELMDPEVELEKGNYGTLEPKMEFRRSVPLEKADVVLVPGVAWDRLGYRIGYGAGYYDRSINSSKKRLTTIGLAYEFQVVPRIPTTRYDRHVDKLVTEERIIETNSQ